MRKAAVSTLLTVGLIMAAAAPSFAQQALKIVVVNSARVFEQSAEGKRTLAQLQDKDAKIKTDLKKMNDAISTLKSRLSTGQLTMTSSAIAAMQADIDKKTTEGKRFQEDANREFTAFRDGLVAKAQQDMLLIVQNLRKEKAYDIVFDLTSSGIVDYAPALEITDEVIRRYDASKAGAPAVK
jgi:outer membrane protein